MKAFSLSVLVTILLASAVSFAGSRHRAKHMSDFDQAYDRAASAEQARHFREQDQEREAANQRDFAKAISAAAAQGYDMTGARARYAPNSANVQIVAKNVACLWTWGSTGGWEGAFPETITCFPRK